MINRIMKRKDAEPVESPMGFDDFDLRLGDMMRGERATLGKSLLDVQRELHIKAKYISAIEDCNPDAFETPGFISGFVRSYARYLGMDPDQCFDLFCKESGFKTAHGMSSAASTIRKSDKASGPIASNNPFETPKTPFAPESEGFFDRLEPGAIGSALVLIGLIAGIGYGGYALLNEVQRVQIAPVEQTPVLLTDLDPVAKPTADINAAGVFTPPVDAMERLYQPQALDVPVMVARDAPISTLDPSNFGVFTAGTEAIAQAPEAVIPQVVEADDGRVTMIAVKPAWVRISAADGSVLFEKIMDAGEQFTLPKTEDAPVLRAGMAGSIFFRVGEDIYGPAGVGTGTVRDLALGPETLKDSYAIADLEAHDGLADAVAVASAAEGE